MAPNLSHKLLGGEDEFVVDEPAWPVLKHRAVRVHHHSLVVFNRAVVTPLVQLGCVVEETRRDRLQQNNATEKMYITIEMCKTCYRYSVCVFSLNTRQCHVTAFVIVSCASVMGKRCLHLIF